MMVEGKELILFHLNTYIYIMILIVKTNEWMLCVGRLVVGWYDGMMG